MKEKPDNDRRYAQRACAAPQPVQIRRSPALPNRHPLHAITFTVTVHHLHQRVDGFWDGGLTWRALQAG